MTVRSFSPSILLRSLLLGLLGFVGAFFTLHYRSQDFEIFITWSIVFPLLASLAYGSRYGLITGTLGLGACFPLFIYLNNGWAAVIASLRYLAFYCWQGYCSQQRRSHPAIWNHAAAAFLPFELLSALLSYLLYPWAFSHNPPPWAPAAEVFIPEFILKGIIIKDGILLFLLLIIADCLLRVNGCRRLLGLTSCGVFRQNGQLLGASLVTALLIWVVMLVFNRIFIDHTSPYEALTISNPYEEIAFILFFAASFLVAALLMHYAELRCSINDRLLQNEQRYRSLFTNARDGIFIIDIAAMNIVDANHTACQLMGYSFSELHHQPVVNLHPPAWRPAAEAAIHQKDPYAATYLFNSVIMHRTGDLIPVEISTSLPFLSDGRMLAVGFFRDITERKLAEEKLQLLHDELEQKVLERTQELQQLNHDLQHSNAELFNTLEILQKTQTRLIQSEKMAGLGSLVAGVSHEINTPVGIAITAASYLDEMRKDFFRLYQANSIKRHTLEDFLQQCQEATVIILNNLERAAQLIRSFKQVSADQSTEIRRQFNFRSYCEEILLNLQPQLKRTSLTVILDCPNDLEITSYPGAFAQIFTNLIMNSLLHAYEPGATGRLTLTAVKTAAHLIISFKDDGKGMADNIKDKIFEPFFTTKRREGGTGLGLHIIYNIITLQLSGTVECFSQTGGGTEFIINLPRDILS